MKNRAKIFASLLLLFYLSFLFHEIFAHNHHHESEKQHCCETGSSLAHVTEKSNCNHFTDHCSFCEGDELLHKQLVFAKQKNPVSDNYLPSGNLTNYNMVILSVFVVVGSNEIFKDYFASAICLRGPPLLS